MAAMAARACAQNCDAVAGPVAPVVPPSTVKAPPPLHEATTSEAITIAPLILGPPIMRG
jgi:hypothetical protein